MGGTDFLDSTVFAESQATSDGGLACAFNALHDLSIYEPFLMKLDAMGEVQWVMRYGRGPIALQLCQTRDGGFMVGGFKTAAGQRGFVMKLSRLGKVLWARELAEVCFGIAETSDN